MRQVLFYIPFTQIPVFGYGMMLFLAFASCLFVASRRARTEGVPPEKLQDVAIWVLLFGLLGARTTYMIQYQVPLASFFMIWEGGLVFYGCLIGGAVGYVIAYFLVVRKHQISTWKMADIIASCIPLGLALGRMGCFLNGCCFGNVACTTCPAVHFPMSSAARHAMVERGLQTAAGFVMDDENDKVRVAAVELGSPAAEAGLRAGDVIVKVDGQGVESYETFSRYVHGHWPRGETKLALTVKRPSHDGSTKEIDLKPFEHSTLGLHPTQVYESISMILLFLMLNAFYPFRRRVGSVMALFMVCYGVHRFLNEMLRKDTDPVAFGLTLSQNGSILLFAGGLVLGLVLWLRPGLRPGGPPATTVGA